MRFYRLDLADLYGGGLSVLRAARLASQLPPDAAIFRGGDLDSRVWSKETHMLRHLINVWVDEKDAYPLPSEQAAKLEAEQRRIAKAQARAKGIQRIEVGRG